MDCYKKLMGHKKDAISVDNETFIASFLNYKESTGFEPARRYKPVRRISSPLHCHSANSPERCLLYQKFVILNRESPKICD